MSCYYFLVCHEDRTRIHVAQGGDSTAATAFYSGAPETMRQLLSFLNDHLGKSLEFVCADTHDEIYEYTDYDSGPDIACTRVAVPPAIYHTPSGLKSSGEISAAMEGKTVAEIEAAGGDPFAGQNPDEGELD